MEDQAHAQSEKEDKPNTSSDINTGGGSSVGRDVRPGGDFIGRDRTTIHGNVTINQSSTLIAALLVLVVGIMLWAIYHFRFPVPLATPTPTATNTATPSATPTPPHGEVWTNPKDGAVYVWIPPGEFMMGSSITDTLVYTNERPQHKVVLNGFWIMQTEVTNAQYKRCVEATMCRTPNNSQWDDRAYAKHPVVSISWADAETYADWVSGRLPTEAEWEYACRGTNGRVYPWGNQAPTPQLLNFVFSLKNDTMPVGSYPPNMNELFDMAGNVWEWTADWYNEEYYANSPVSNPQGPESGTTRTLRGGAFLHFSNNVRCATRNGLPYTQDHTVGFRVVSSGP